MATAMGAFLTLTESGVLDGFCGKVMLAGVPAEECLETEWRMQEIQKGRLHFLGAVSYTHLDVYKRQPLTSESDFKQSFVQCNEVHSGRRQDPAARLKNP